MTSRPGNKEKDNDKSKPIDAPIENKNHESKLSDAPQSKPFNAPKIERRPVPKKDSEKAASALRAHSIYQIPSYHACKNQTAQGFALPTTRLTK